MQRKWLNIMAGSVVVLAIAYQAYVIAQQAFRDKAGPKVNVEKLLTDLRSPEYKTKHAALHSILALAGADKLRPQLLNAGFTRALLEVARKANLDDTSNEILPLSLIAVTKLVRDDTTGRAGAELVEHKALSRLLKVIKKGVPGWTAAAASLLHAISKSGTGELEGAVREKVIDGNSELLVPAAINLLEGGAYANHTDAVVSAMKLLELLVLAGGESRAATIDSDAQRVMLQVLTSFKNNSQVAGATAQTLVAVVDADHSVLAHLAEAGTVPYLLSELRAFNRFSFPPILALVQRLVNNEEARADLVAAGLLSVCAQVMFNQSSLDEWRLGCLSALSDLASEPGPPAGAAGNVGFQRRAAVSALMKMANQVSNVPLHSATVEALRDAGTSRAACEEMVAQGVLPMLSTLLARKVGSEHIAAKAWLMQTQRSAGMLSALIALQPSSTLRKSIGQSNLIEALAEAIHNQLGSDEALYQQVRLTAAAALVPILSEASGEYDARVIASGVLADLITLFHSRHESERQVATRVMRILSRVPDVAAMYERSHIKLPPAPPSHRRG